MVPLLPVYQLHFSAHIHPEKLHKHTHTHMHPHKLPTGSINSLKHWVRHQRNPAALSQYSHRVALSKVSALAFSPPAWSPLRYFPPTARMATLLRSQNSKRNWTGAGLLHSTAVSSPTHQYFPWESGHNNIRRVKLDSHTARTAQGDVCLRVQG